MAIYAEIGTNGIGSFIKPLEFQFIFLNRGFGCTLHNGENRETLALPHAAISQFLVAARRVAGRNNDLENSDAPAIHRLLNLQSATRLVVALFGAACVLGCPLVSASDDRSESSRSVVSHPLKIWHGPEKHPFLLDDLHGNQRDLQALAGKVVLVHFFATWCEPCVSEMASLQRLATATRGKPLAILAVDVAEVDLRVRTFFEKHPVDFTVVLDRDRAVSKSWDVIALPTTFVLDANLVPKLFTEGDIDWSAPDVLAPIEALYPATDRPQDQTITSQ